MCESRLFKCLVVGLVAAFSLVSCAMSPEQRHPLLPVLRQLGSDLPVRRTELMNKCHLKDVPSTRLNMGLRGGWGGVFECWSFPDGTKLIGRFHVYCGGFKIVIDDSKLHLADDPGFSSKVIPKVPAPTWFNEIELVDRDGRILFSNERRPVVTKAHGSVLPGN